MILGAETYRSRVSVRLSQVAQQLSKNKKSNSGHICVTLSAVSLLGLHICKCLFCQHHIKVVTIQSFFFYFVADEFSLVRDKPDLHKKPHLQKNSVQQKWQDSFFLTFVLAIPILIKCLI